MIYLNLKETNWHLREESLLLMQMIFNSTSETFPFELYEEVAENIIEVLDDTKPKVILKTLYILTLLKVRNTARETIVIILRHSSQSMDLAKKIQPLLEKELYEYVVFRIQNPDSNTDPCRFLKF